MKHTQQNITVVQKYFYFKYNKELANRKKKNERNVTSWQAKSECT